MQLYSLKQIINPLLQAEVILKICLESSPFDAEKNDVVRTGGIIKQAYFVKNLHDENLKLLNKITCKHIQEII